MLWEADDDVGEDNRIGGLLRATLGPLLVLRFMGPAVRDGLTSSNPGVY